jgi:hypothetical protein
VARPDGPPPGHRHRFDPAALLAGLLFLSTAGWFAGTALADHEIPIAVALPTLLIAFAVVGFVRVATRSRR